MLTSQVSVDRIKGGEIVQKNIEVGVKMLFGAAPEVLIGSNWQSRKGVFKEFKRYKVEPIQVKADGQAFRLHREEIDVKTGEPECYDVFIGKFCQCSCPGFSYARHNMTCKHIEAIKAATT